MKVLHAHLACTLLQNLRLAWQAQPNDAKEARPMQVAGGLANRQCSKSSGGLPCLPVWTDALTHTVQLVYTSSGPYDTQSYLRVFVDKNPQPVLTTFINIDECAVSSADHLLCVSSHRARATSHAPLCSYVGFTVGKGQVAGPIILENVSFAPSGSVMTMMTLVIFCAFSVLISFLQGRNLLRALFDCMSIAEQRTFDLMLPQGSLSFWRNKASLRKEQYLYANPPRNVMHFFTSCWQIPAAARPRPRRRR